MLQIYTIQFNFYIWTSDTLFLNLISSGHINCHMQKDTFYKQIQTYIFLFTNKQMLHWHTYIVTYICFWQFTHENHTSKHSTAFWNCRHSLTSYQLVRTQSHRDFSKPVPRTVTDVWGSMEMVHSTFCLHYGPLI